MNLWILDNHVTKV